MSRSTGRARRLEGFVEAVIVALLLSSTPSGQQPQREQQPVFRGGANFVNVDVYPRRDGRVVEGLTAADFQVFEDGKPQKVEQFELIRIDPNTPDAERRDPNTQREGEQLLDDPRRRVFVVYLDEYHISRETARFVRAPLVEFLERTIGRTDLFALMTPDVPVTDLIFGQRLDVVETALAGFWQRMQFLGPDPINVRPRTAYEEFLYNCYNGRTDNFQRNERFIRSLMDRHRMDLVLTSLEQLSARLASLRDERTNVLLFSPGWTLDQPTDSGGMAWGADGALPGIGVTRGGRITTSPTQPYTADRTKCDTEYLRLAGIDFPRRFNSLVEDARRSNVSFTTIDPGGLDAPVSAAEARMIRNRGDALRTLSENTDGLAIVDTNDLRTPLATPRRQSVVVLPARLLLDEHQSRRAVSPDRGEGDRAERQGHGRGPVTARSPQSIARAAESAPPPRAGTTPVEDALGVLGRLRPAADLFTYGAAWPGRLALVVELPSGQVGQGRWAGGVDVLVSVAGASGEALGTARGRIEPSTRSVLLNVPLASSAAGPWRASIRVGEGADRLEDRVEVSPGPDGAIGAPLIFRAGPSPQTPVRPAADPQFFRTERIQVEWPVREAVDKREARILGRNGQPLALTPAVTDRQSDGQAVLAVAMNLAPLTTGDYVLELTVVRGDRTDRSLVAFRVVR